VRAALQDKTREACTSTQRRSSRDVSRGGRKLALRCRTRRASRKSCSFSPSVLLPFGRFPCTPPGHGQTVSVSQPIRAQHCAQRHRSRRPRKARPARLRVTVSPCPPARPIAHSAQHRRSRRPRKARPAHPLVQRAVVQDVLVHGLEQLRRLLAHLVGRLAHGAAHLLSGAADLLRHSLHACAAWTRKSATQRARGALATAAKRPCARACCFRAGPHDATAGLPPRRQAAAERACRRRALLRRGLTSQSARGGPGEHFERHHVDA